MSSRRREPDEVKRILVNADDTTGPYWYVERWSTRWIFIGPHPGKFMFHSVEAKGWPEAILAARRRWNTMSRVRRERWYGDKGKFTTGTG